MRLLLNTLTAVRRRTGVGHYVSELSRCLAAYEPELEVIAYPPPRLHGMLRSGSAASPKPDRFWNPWLNRLRRAVAACHFQHFTGRQRYDLYHEPNFIPLPCDRPTVATLLDLSVVLHPHWHPADRVRHFERHLPRALANCTHFVAISDFCRDELIARLGIPPRKITVTYMGVRRHFRPLQSVQTVPVLRRLQLPERYLLYVGTLEPRKNILMLMKAYCSLPSSLRSRCPLVLVGGWGWRTAELRDFFERQARPRGVRHLGYSADEDLPAIYNGARALVFPSFYEGFGLPPLEMMACGGPVLASTAGAVRETAGSRACLLDPHDPDAWRSAMQRIITDDDWRRQLRDGVVEAAEPFTWEDCAARTFHVYRTVAGAAECTA